MLNRKLKNHVWSFSNKRLKICDEKTKKFIILDKVRMMSLHKFIPNCLDRMRIEDNKAFREKIREIRARKKGRK